MRQRNGDAFNRLLYYSLLILPVLIISFALVEVVFPYPIAREVPEGAINPTRLEQIRWAWIAITTLVISSVAHAVFRSLDPQQRIAAVGYYGGALVIGAVLIRALL